jgi:tripartite-type tricarboxylate transporter receptor subunit TctC
MWPAKRVFVSAALALLAGLAGAQPFPNKPVKFIVPFPPGGGAESTARLVAQKLSERLGQAVVVETKPGAGGNIGTEFVARSPKDGYTMLLATSGMSIQPHLARLGWDPIKDFAPIGLIASYALVIAAHPSVSAQNLPDLVSQAKANPGKISYGSSGSGGPLHMGAELFSHQAGIKLLHVPYKGNAPMTLAILGGEINLVFDSLVGPLPNIRAGKLKAMAWTGKKRNPNLPDVPTVGELKGLQMAQFEYESWNGVVVAAGTPPEVVNKLSQELAQVMAMPEVKERLTAMGYEPRSEIREEFGAVIAHDYKRFGQVIREAGIKLD